MPNVLKQGDAAPEFSLSGVDGATVSLSDFDDTPLVIIAIRSITCHTSARQLSQIRDSYGSFREAGVPILVIVPAQIEDVVTYFKENNFPMIGLADPERNVAGEYGQAFSPELGWLPVTVVLDKDHHVFYTRYGVDYSDVAGSGEILDIISRLTPVAKG